MAAIDTVLNFGRIAVLADPSIVLVSINANGATYATASGGLPIDLAQPLSQAQPFSMAYINPADVVGILQIAVPTSANYYPSGIVFGTPTYTNPAVYPFAGGSASNVRPDLQLATFPATIRLYTIAGAEVADGVINQTGIVLALLLARGGQNVN